MLLWITPAHCKQNTVPPGTNMAIDPICGMTVDEATSLHVERDGATFYFCSEHCRNKFLATPATVKHEEKKEQKPKGKAIYTCRCTLKCSRTIPAIAPSAA